MNTNLLFQSKHYVSKYCMGSSIDAMKSEDRRVDKIKPTGISNLMHKVYKIFPNGGLLLKIENGTVDVTLN